MPVITPTRFASKGTTTATEITLDGATDTFEYVDGETRWLILRNPTAGAISPVIDGDEATTAYCPGIGDIDISTGYSVGSIAAGTTAIVDLQSIRMYLKGVISVLTGAGLVAVLHEQ